MKNWLITADIHIDDYPQANYENRSRLNQFLKLADRYVELAQEYDCDTIVLCGDTVNKPTNRPYVLNVVQKVLQKISDNFKNVYYIFGQHDLDSKSNIVSRNDSLLTALEFDNFHYMDHRQLTLESGVRVAFKDWTPVQDVSWIEGTVDVLFAHFTKSLMFGQEIDESKFKLMISGDIHTSQEIGKFISIGTPLQKDMSSQQRGTCIIFNPNDATWDRIGTDDSHTRFLRIDYVSDPSEEGFEGPLQYHIYKPRTTSKENSNKNATLEWTEVDELTSDLVESKGLAAIHAEVRSQNPDIHEIDFNFKLRKLQIHGFRSIEDLEIDFEGNDRILLQGDNGSGKSSIVKALRACFATSRFIRNDQSDFTSELKLTLDLDYQNKSWRIIKGSDTWGLLIDGEVQNYNNKTEFEDDLVKKLPFLNYLDLMFIMSGTNNLSAQFTPDRRIELLSKFYRLDRIEAYYNISQGLVNERNQKITEYKESLNRTIGGLDSINRRLEELSDYKEKVRTEFESELNRLNKMREDSESHKNWQSKRDQLQTQVNIHKNSVGEFEKRMTLNVDECNQIITENKDRGIKIAKKIEEVQLRSYKLQELQKDKKDSLEKAQLLKREVDSLESGVCPTCGSKVCNEHTTRKLNELKEEGLKLKEKYLKACTELESFKSEELTPGFYVDAVKKLKDAQKDCQDTIVLYSNKLTQHNVAKESLESEKIKLEQAERALYSHNNIEPADVVLPIDFNEQLFNATSELTKFDEYCKLDNTRLETEMDILSIKSTISNLQGEIDKYLAYSQLMSRTGEVMESILKKMATAFSDSQFKYEVVSGVFRSKPYIQFNSFFNVKNKWRIYENLSDGQKTVSDIDFLSKLFSLNVGLLVMDESLKHLDFRMGPLAFEKLASMNVNTIMISTHDANFTNFTKKINLELDSEGKTKAVIT